MKNKKLSFSIFVLAGLAAFSAHSQIKDLGPSLGSVPADLMDARPKTETEIANAGAGINIAAEDDSAGQFQQPSTPVEAAAAKAQANAVKTIRAPAKTLSAQRHGIERAVFDRAPVKVPLPVGVERLITLPAPAALHVPPDMDKVVRLEIIDKTIYATAKVPFTSLRVIAELIDSGQQIPLDLVADKSTSASRAELEVFVTETTPHGSGPAEQAAAAAQQDAIAPEPPAADMVQLTRYAARQLYAPKRLTGKMPGMQQVDVQSDVLPDLFRGVNVLSQPIGQWRSGSLYVTAVLVRNRSQYPVEIPLEQVRGKWISATAQHGRVGPAGTETDTTAVYLVCERRFEACR